MRHARRRRRPACSRPIQRAEREDSIADWLDAHGLPAALATSLSETAVTLDSLDRISTAVEGPALDAVLRWAAAGCSVRQLASEIQDAATRISGLVQAVKGFTHMDQATVAEPMDLAGHLGNTITILRSKARGKAVAVSVDVEPDLPPVRGVPAELNQVWVNLIDNALDAAPQGGNVTVSAARRDALVDVHVLDDGAGIPADIQERIFDPFFTTKDVGKGTGLGLDIVRRLVERHDGDIDVTSVPGRTQFTVSLPIANPQATERQP